MDGHFYADDPGPESEHGEPPADGRFDGLHRDNGGTPPPHNGPPPNASPIITLKLPATDWGQLPPRAWAYGNYLQFGQAALLGAVDGGGKGSMAVTIALAMITGRALLSERVWRPGPVALISYEDSPEEWHRRIMGACHHYGIDISTVIGQFHFIEKRAARVVFGVSDEPGVIEALKEIGAVLVIVDPFNQCHAAEDGNNNAEIARVASAIDRMARESGAAALVLHHLRKSSTGQVDDLMGATSLRATFRSSRVLRRMQDDEAEALSVTADPWRYSRLSSSKENYSPPADQSTWFKLESISLENGTADYPDGDSVAVCTTWQPPAVFRDIDSATMRTIFAAIRTGLPDGEFYSPAKQAKTRWVGQTVLDAASKSPAEADRVIKTWIKNGVLTVENYYNLAQRKDVSRVVLDEAKAAAILGPDRSGGGNA